MALSEISLPAFGKINLLLDVGKTREDGFHEVSMLMQEVDVADEVKQVLEITPVSSVREVLSALGILSPR